MSKHANASTVVLLLLFMVMCFTGTERVVSATYTTPRLLNTDDTYELRRDGWSEPEGGSAYTGDVIPKVDANDGNGGDNPFFRRHNVARAWATGGGYWYTGTDQFENEPAPLGEQWVEYAPPFEVLGSANT